MFNSRKRREKEKKASSEPSALDVTLQPTLAVEKTAAVQPPLATPLGGRAWKIGQTIPVTGLGEFLIHDIKGGEGKSGMGIVYIVLDPFSTPYAVKTLQRQFLDTQALVRQFLRECET